MLRNAFPIDASATGRWIDELFWYAAGLTGATFLVVVLILAWFLLRYSERPGHRVHYTHGDSRAAFALTAGLALLVFFGIDVNLAFRDHRVWQLMWGDPPQAAEAVRIQIMPEQFVWNIRYPGPDGRFKTADDITTINVLHVPPHRPVLVQLSSKDVVHSFFLPNLRIKMDAVPGLVTGLYFTAVRPGTYDIACAEHCGFGHYKMRGELTVEDSVEAFDAWLAARAAEDEPDRSWGWEWEGPRT